MSMSGDPRQRLKQLQARLKGEVPPVSAGGPPPSESGAHAAGEAEEPLRGDADPQWQVMYEGVRESVLKLRSTPKSKDE
ncbi:hypothetical protein [Paenibacillus daejeonensis]|uniref:hypothetical protein n=1 Tax=Paenibacillus daejeonensis TaxID=135193 RepID=UPI0003744D4F|nr:hypothetical protein [Paenibacillus daejeonensis]